MKGIKLDHDHFLISIELYSLCAIALDEIHHFIYYDSMRKRNPENVEFNFFISKEMFEKIARLQEAGLSSSAIARLAVRKCSSLPLELKEELSLPKRIQVYLHKDDAALLDELVAKEGDRSRSRILRRLIGTYLRINASAIESALF